MLIIREMQIKTAMRYHLYQSEWPSSTSLETINAGEGTEKREHVSTVGGIFSLKKLKIELQYDLAIPLLDI